MPHILRIVIILAVIFLAYKFLDIIFAFAKPYFTGRNKTAGKNGEKKAPEIIETKFVEREDDGNDVNENNNKE